jgi:hypothetical protein
MLTGDQYAALYGALLDRGYALVNDPAAYEEAHYLPLAYPALAGETPQTVWTDRADVGEAWSCTSSCGTGTWSSRTTSSPPSTVGWRRASSRPTRPGTSSIAS